MAKNTQNGTNAPAKVSHDSGERARPEDTRRKQRESSRRAFGDPLEIIASKPCSAVLREHCKEVADMDDRVKQQIRKISVESGKSVGPYAERIKTAHQYVATREVVTEEVAGLIKITPKSGFRQHETTKQ